MMDHLFRGDGKEVRDRHALQQGPGFLGVISGPTKCRISRRADLRVSRACPVAISPCSRTRSNLKNSSRINMDFQLFQARNPVASESA